MRRLLRRLTLARKLWLAIGLVAAVLSALGLWQVTALHQGERALFNLFDNQLVPIRLLREVGDAYGSTTVFTARMVRSGALGAEEGLARLDQAATRAGRAWEDLAASARDEEREALAEAEAGIRELQPTLRGLRQRLAAMAPAGLPLETRVSGAEGAELGTYLDVSYLPRLDRVQRALTALADLKERHARQAVGDAAGRTARSQTLAPLLIFGGFLAALWIGRLLAEDLGGSVARMAAHVRRVANGELEHRIHLRGQDELSELAEELNRMGRQLQETVATLREREATQRSLLQSARTLIYTTGLDGLVQSFNHAAEQMLGYSADEVVGRFSPARFHDPEELAQRTEELNRARRLSLEPGLDTLTYLPRHGEVEQREWRFRRSDGSCFPGLAVACPIRNDYGQLLGFLTVVTDITAQKEAEVFQDRLQAVLDLTPDFVAMAEVPLDAEGQMAGPPRLLYTNKAFEPLRQVVVSKGRDPELLFSYLPPWAVQMVGEEALPELVTQGHWRGETALVGPLGLEFPVDQVLIAHRDEAGRATHFSTIARDIRREKARERLLREREARLQAINRASPIGIFITDPDAGMSYVNPAFEEITGLVEEDLPFRDWLAALHPQDHAAVRAAWPVVVENRVPFESEARFLHTDGTVRWARIQAAPVWDGDRFLGYVGCLMDLTEVKEIHAELKASEARALAASQAKSAFLSNMSHELRTPLNAILGYAQLMARTPGRSAGDQDQLDRIHNAGEHLLGLINDVLSIAKIESGKLTLHQAPFDTRKLFQTLHDLVSGRATSKRLGFEMDIQEDFPARLEGDEGKLRQVLVNLLGNAVKFTAEGGVVFRARYAGGCAAFEVEDTGPGISEQDQAHLFQSFYQAAGTAAAEGTGLGLSISRAMVRLMGGDIHVRSQAGQGSTFAFEVPLASAEGAAEPLTRGKVLRASPGQGHFRMLVADDRPENRDLLCQLLRSVGLEALAAGDGAEAVALWWEWKPHLVWMDIRMPVMDGFMALQEIRLRERQHGLPPTKVVAITASVIDQDRASMMARGFDDYLAKPFREAVIFDILSRHLDIAWDTEEAAPPGPEAFSLQGLPDLPADWRRSFQEAVSSGDTPTALAMAEGLEDTGLALALKHHLKAYRLEELLQALTP